MFGIWQVRKLRVHGYWNAIVPDFQCSVSEFYAHVRELLEERRIPDLEVSEILFREGGAFSAERRYLRLRRERLVFDVCAAPFGTSWFFSCRQGEIPVSIRWWECAAMAGAVAALLLGHWALFGPAFGSALFALNGAAFMYLLGTLVSSGLYGVDAALLRFPVLGAFYERFLRGDTYFRDDTRRMYLSTVDRLVRDAVEEFAGAKPGTTVNFQEDPVPTGMSAARRLAEALRFQWLRAGRG